MKSCIIFSIFKNPYPSKKFYYHDTIHPNFPNYYPRWKYVYVNCVRFTCRSFYVLLFLLKLTGRFLLRLCVSSQGPYAQRNYIPENQNHVSDFQCLEISLLVSQFPFPSNSGILCIFHCYPQQLLLWWSVDGKANLMVYLDTNV